MPYLSSFLMNRTLIRRLSALVVTCMAAQASAQQLSLKQFGQDEGLGNLAVTALAPETVMAPVPVMVKVSPDAAMVCGVAVGLESVVSVASALPDTAASIASTLGPNQCVMRRAAVRGAFCPCLALPIFPPRTTLDAWAKI